MEYEHAFKVAKVLTKDVREVEKAYKLAVFNVLASNQDDHTKNVAFIMEDIENVRKSPRGTIHTARKRLQKRSAFTGRIGEELVDYQNFSVYV